MNSAESLEVRVLLTDPGDEPPPDDNPPANEDPPPPEDMQPPAGTDPAQEPPGDNLSPHIVQLGSDGQVKLIEWTQTTRDLIAGLFRADVDSLIGEINQTAGTALTGMNGLAPSLEFLSQVTLPGDFSDQTTIPMFDPDSIAWTLKNSLPQFAVLGTVVPDHGWQEDPGTGTISAMTPFGPYSVNLLDGTRTLDATYTFSAPPQAGVDIDRTAVSMTWMDGAIDWLIIDFDREFQGNGLSRRFQYHYSGAAFSPAIHSGSITFDDGLHSGGTSFVASGGAVTSSQTWINVNYPDLTLGGIVTHISGVTTLDGFLASIYEVDQGVSTAFLLGLHREPTLTFFSSGLAIHAADDRYAGLTYWLRNRPDEPTEFELAGTFHTPLAPVNGAMTYGLGEIRIDPTGTSHSFGISVIPQTKSFLDLRTIIRQEPDGSETFWQAFEWHF